MRRSARAGSPCAARRPRAMPGPAPARAAIAFPSDGDERASSVHPWDVLARDGALDVIAGYTASGDYPGALWRTSLAP